MTNYYTGNGDKGYTGIMGRTGVKKSSKLMNVIGSLDELNSTIGVVIASLPRNESELSLVLKSIQNDLFIVGAEISYYNKDKTFNKKMVESINAQKLEKHIDVLSSKLPELTKFVLPGGSIDASVMHLARAVSRRAERAMVDLSDEKLVDEQILKYLNRLSSFLFVAALYLNNAKHIKESNPVFE